MVAWLLFLVGVILLYTLPIVTIGTGFLADAMSVFEFIGRHPNNSMEALYLSYGIFAVDLSVANVGNVVIVLLNKKLVVLSIFNANRTKKQIEASKKMAKNYKKYLIIYGISAVTLFILGLVLIFVEKGYIADYIGINSSLVKLGSGALLCLIFGIVGFAVMILFNGYLLYSSNDIKESDDTKKQANKNESNYIEELKSLKELLDSNVITQDEFEKKKAELLKK